MSEGKSDCFQVSIYYIRTQKYNLRKDSWIFPLQRSNQHRYRHHGYVIQCKEDSGGTWSLMVKVVVSRSLHIIFGPRNLKSERTAGYFPCNNQVNTGTASTATPYSVKRTAEVHGL